MARQGTARGVAGSQRAAGVLQRTVGAGGEGAMSHMKDRSRQERCAEEPNCPPVSRAKERTGPTPKNGSGHGIGALEDARRALPSTAARALRIHVQRIDRMARRHEQAIASWPTETKVCRALRRRNLPDRLTLRRKDRHAIMAGTHAPASPQRGAAVAEQMRFYDAWGRAGAILLVVIREGLGKAYGDFLMNPVREK
jgi:hypothetical protein